jgi:tetratricopeptide (TPR) repeat protein
VNEPFDASAWFKVLAVSIIVILMGVSPYPPRFQANLARAERAAGFHSYLSASDATAQAAGLVPWRGDLWERAGLYAMQGGAPEQAREYLERAESLSALSTQGWLTLAETNSQLCNLAAAVHAWEMAIEKGAGEVDVLSRMLDEYYLWQDYAGARGTLQRLVTLQPEKGAWHFQFGLLLAAFQPDRALAPLAQAALLEPDYKASVETLRGEIGAAGEAEIAYQLVASGRGLAMVGEWRLASQAFKQATIERPDYAEAWAFYGEALQHRQGDASERVVTMACSEVSQSDPDEISQKSLEALQTALRLGSDSLATNIFMALYWQRANRYEDALEYLCQAERLAPENPAILAELGNTLALMGKPDLALENYQKAVTLTPGLPTYQVRLVEFAIQNRYMLTEIALPAATKLTQTYAEVAAYQDLLGQVYRLLEELDRAAIHVVKAIELDRSYAPAYLHLAEIQFMQGDNENAHKNLAVVLSLAPGTPLAEQANFLMRAHSP